MRSAKNVDGSHLLAALGGKGGVVAAQTEAGAKTNEIPMTIPLLDGRDLAGMAASRQMRSIPNALLRATCTGAALTSHSRSRTTSPARSHPRRAALARRAGQPCGRRPGYGRISTRTIQVLDAPEGLPFRHGSQVYLIEWHVIALDGTLRQNSPHSASPA